MCWAPTISVSGFRPAPSPGISERRPVSEYTVIGDPVNEAARLTELAKNEKGNVLASATAVMEARDEEALRWDVGETVELRGRNVPTQVARPRH